MALTADRTKAMAVALVGMPDDAEVELAALDLPTRAAATVLGFHPEHVRRLIRTGRLRARRVGGDYRVAGRRPLAAPRGPLPRARAPAAVADSAGGHAGCMARCEHHGVLFRSRWERRRRRARRRAAPPGRGRAPLGRRRRVDRGARDRAPRPGADRRGGRGTRPRPTGRTRESWRTASRSSCSALGDELGDAAACRSRSSIGEGWVITHHARPIAVPGGASRGDPGPA